MKDSGLAIRQAATLACLLEVTAPKVGNVHRGADFEDLCLADFVISATALGESMTDARDGVGAAVLRAVSSTQSLVATNTNLGIALLIAPLAAAECPHAANIETVLARLTDDDGANVYEAIRTANPGGLGEAESMDVNESTAPPSLMEAMQAAADRDLIALQYANRFAEVFRTADRLEALLQDEQLSVESAIVIAHLELLAEHGDSLVARKLGPAASQEIATRAQQVVALRSSDTEGFWAAVADLDFFLRCDGHQRNPGATADLIAAALFTLLREGRAPRPLPTASKMSSLPTGEEPR